MDFGRVQPESIKFEIRQLSRPDIAEAQKSAAGGKFGRFLSGIGRFAGAVMAPLSIMFPPAAIGAAAAYGFSRIGDMVQVSAARKQLEHGGGPMANSYLPGLNQTALDLTNHSNNSFDPMQHTRDQQALGVLTARNDLSMESAAMMKELV